VKRDATHRGLRTVLLAKAAAGLALTGAFAAAWWLRAHGLTLADWQNELRRGSEPRFEWRSVDRKHWQAQALRGTAAPTASEPPEVTDAREGNSAGCPSGMVRVKGSARMELFGPMSGEIERLQDAACTDWISKDFPARCRTFDREKIASEVAKLPTKPLDFCMDRFEYPNVLGESPVIVVTFREAESLCKKSQKRLCSESEWTFACEGEEVRPYPYGYTRDATACVVDRAWRPFTEGALQPRDGTKAREELDRLWQGEPSGSRAACKSPFGVYDMTGNVDEWTRTVKSTGYASVLKGGYWGPVRARCRPATRAHNEDFVAYQQGFRCCAESNGAVPAPPPVPPVAALPDAGVPSAASTAPRNAPRADLEPEWNEGGEDDEVDAITRARVGLACSAGVASPLGRAPAPAVPLLAAAAVAASALRWRRRRPERRPRGRSS